jgi:uncharacterized alkaline shock family protein YloU
MTDFSADSTRASSGPPPFAPVSPRRDEPPFGSGAGGAGAPGAGTVGPGTAGAGTADPGTTRDADGTTPGTAPGTETQGSTTTPGAPSAPTTAGNGAPRSFGSLPEVKGRIDVADEVVEKVAGLAAAEVPGVAELGGDLQRALENVRERIGIGQKRGDQGIKAKVSGRDVSVDVTIVIEYGHVVMDVARNVKGNVARQTSRMLGLNVVEVNVTVDDITLPQAKTDERGGDGGVSLDG